MRRNKFNAIPTHLDGIRFDSKAEGYYYLQLKLEKEKGLIKDFELQPKFEIIPNFTKNGITFKKRSYIADFKVFHENGKIEIIDVKGKMTEVFKIKRMLFELNYPALSLTLLKFNYDTNQFERIEDHAAKKAKQTKKRTTKSGKSK